MRSRTANWFETKVRYEKTTEEGTQKKVTEQYVVDALSFSEAEQRITEEMSAYISGELASPSSVATQDSSSELGSPSLLRQFEITDVRKAAYNEVFFSDEEMADKWYKAKLMFITIDERTEKEKRSAVTYLVQAGTFDGAVKNINEVMGSTMIDYEKSNISETKIMDVFEHVAKKEENPEHE